MDPVPSINRAYSMVQSVEKQKKVHLEIADTTENTALHVKGGQRFDKKRYNVDKRTQYCTHCERAGHNKDSCFKLHGTPDWYKELVDKKKRDAGELEDSLWMQPLKIYSLILKRNCCMS
ncbi:UNVERIFIED_CONTAM: hypothetical protein Sradi_1639900 [Sesamum radiatum]|uniref:Uncharacterized protein n=1 Tax=Sesamum radiatum TaxID=300843 RepID=A0AAW2UCK1_SESRA